MNNLILIETLGIMKPKENSLYKKNFGLYECFCGNKFKAIISSVKTGNTKSCGCVKNKDKIKHNYCRTRLYNIWSGIIQRCINKNSEYFHRYGGRGISICKDWRVSFIKFKEWSLLNGYGDNLSIDRIDNNGNYEPSNCRWTTKEVQSRNKSVLFSNNSSGYKGVTWHIRDRKWNAKISVNNKRIHLGYFDTAIECAKAYNEYVIANNLEHTLNIIKE